MEVLVFGQWSSGDDEEEEIGHECLLVAPTYLHEKVHMKLENVKNPQKYFKRLRRLGIRWSKRHGSLKKWSNKDDVDDVGTDATDSMSSAWDSSMASIVSSVASSIASHFQPSIQARIKSMGLIDCDRLKLVPDFVSPRDDVADQISLPQQPQHENIETEQVVHVKTGIWQIICMDDNGNPQPPFFVATAVCMEDKVDMKKLRKLIFSNQTQKRRPKITMAPKDIAERLAGYKSGTMAPISHSVNSMLFIDEGILQNSGSTRSQKSHRVNIGCGKVGQCLSLLTDDFITISQANPEGMRICSLVQ